MSSMASYGNSTPVPPDRPRLRGEAPPGLYGFEDENGAPVVGGEGIIPILELIDDSRYRFIGTGFFITDLGVFATAKHVIAAPHQNGNQIYIWNIILPNEWMIRPVIQINCHDTADLAVGVPSLAINPETKEPLLNARVRLTLRAHTHDDRVSTFAYPNTEIQKTEEGHILDFRPGFYEGEILECFPNGRDCVLLPGPCFRTSMIIHHGASGGPVAGPSGRVFAVNSTGFDGTDDSYISQIDGILSLPITMEGDHGAEQITIGQLAEQGIVTIDP